MSKFNTTTTRPSGVSPVVASTLPDGCTYEGGPSYSRDPRSELFLLAVSNMVGEGSFYESANDRDTRFATLVAHVAVEDGDWLARFTRWLRAEANMRSASLVVAAEAVRARLAAGVNGGNRELIAAALQRPDEPGEMLAYWTARYGRAIPKPIKRGISDAVQRLYNERALLKYDTGSRGFRFGDVLELTHATPMSPWQGDLFAYAITRRHGRDQAAPDTLPMVRARAALDAIPADDRRAALDPDVLSAAGMTWESVAGWLGGPMDAVAWQAIIPSMGYMALLRNLRNFDRAEVSDEVAERVAAILADPEQVARSRQLPMRFLSAFRAAPSLRWAYPLGKALEHSLTNVPALPGRTLILVDRSGSMFYGTSARTELTYADAAGVFGAALALRAEFPLLVEFGNGSQVIHTERGESPLQVVGRMGNLGGTQTAEALQRHFADHDRVVIVTDEQAFDNPARVLPSTVPVYTWNLAGYKGGHSPSGNANRHTFGGLTDQAFAMIPLLEDGGRADWPF